MPIRQRAGDLGANDARRLGRLAGTELREARLANGLSQRDVARAAGISASALGRLERAEVGRPAIGLVCRAARALGLSASLRLFAAGSPVRDAAHLALLDRLERILAAPLRLRREVALPIHGDLRAWDGVIDGPDGSCFGEGETRLGDMQALARRVELKVRDDPRGLVVILVVSRTAHNQRVLRDHREALRAQFPLDGAAIIRALRAGRLPAASGIVVL